MVSMQSMTIRIPDDLMQWVGKQAKSSNRTKNGQIQHILEQYKKTDDKPRYILNHSGLCHNGTHNFKSSEPSTKDFCNCQMYTYGELKQ